jgi:hypothetical protein
MAGRILPIALLGESGFAGNGCSVSALLKLMRLKRWQAW